MLRLPPSYALRNLLRRPASSALTALGIAAVVFAAAAVLALARGVEVRMSATGSDVNLLMISRRGQSTVFSSIEADELVHLAQLPGLARGVDGEALLSPEIHHVTLVKPAGADGIGVPMHVRGVDPVAYDVHPRVAVVGRLPEAPWECLVGATAHLRLGLPASALAPGSRLSFENHDWTVVGGFSADGALFEGEVWLRGGDLQTALRRRSVTQVVARMESPQAARAALAQFATPGPIERACKGWVESDFYREAMGGLAWMFWVARLLVAAVLVAGALICVNTMLTAVERRIRELATQRVLGFSRADLAAALLVESTALAAIGLTAGLIAALALQGLPLSLNQNAFVLVVDGSVALRVAGLALTIAIAGTAVAAWRALSQPVVIALAGR
jgi:putative ABC transport system permease protein